jgi:hypothetical protein
MGAIAYSIPNLLIQAINKFMLEANSEAEYT